MAVGVSQQASANLVQNGDFTAGTGLPGQLGFNATATGWSVPAAPGSYDFVYTPGSADTTGAPGQYGVIQLWGPGNGAPNGLPATDPAGGNYLASDPAFQNTGPISQTITGLTPGKTYALSFWWAGAQQAGFTGQTTEGWDVSLGGTTDPTATVTVGSHGFSGWSEVTFDYTATSASEVLSFLATGGPGSSEPPFALLGGVNLTQTAPDATSTVTLLGLALSAMGFAARRRH